jgi:hypothetical protein
MWAIMFHVLLYVLRRIHRVNEGGSDDATIITPTSRMSLAFIGRHKNNTPLKITAKSNDNNSI